MPHTWGDPPGPCAQGSRSSYSDGSGRCGAWGSPGSEWEPARCNIHKLDNYIIQYDVSNIDRVLHEPVVHWLLLLLPCISACHELWIEESWSVLWNLAMGKNSFSTKWGTMCDLLVLQPSFSISPMLQKNLSSCSNWNCVRVAAHVWYSCSYWCYAAAEARVVSRLPVISKKELNSELRDVPWKTTTLDTYCWLHVTRQ